jgi:hypothetical protein
MGRLPSTAIGKEVAAVKERLMAEINTVAVKKSGTRAKLTVTTRSSKLLANANTTATKTLLKNVEKTVSPRHSSKVSEMMPRKAIAPDSENEEDPVVVSDTSDEDFTPSNSEYDSNDTEPDTEEPFKVVPESIFLPADAMFPEVKTDQVPKKVTVETSAPTKVFKCGMPECSRTFPSFEQGKEHLLSVHAKSSGNISVQHTSKYHRCGVCSQDFPTSTAVMQHMQLQHKTKISFPSKTTTNKERMQHLMEKLENFDWCQCRLCFVYYRLFLNHVDTAHKNGELGQLLFAKGKSKPPLSMLVPMSKKDNHFIQESAVKIEKELQLLDEGWMNDIDSVDVKPPNASNEIDSKVAKTEIAVESPLPAVETSAAEPMELDNDENYEDTDRYDEYFDNDGINLALPTDHQINISREPSPVPVKSPPPKPKKIVKNTANKVYFQIKKVGDTKKYVCTACTVNNEFTDYSDVMEHFKVHAAKGQTYGVKIGSAIKSGDCIEQLSVKSMILGSVGGACDKIKAIDLVEFQCGVCEDISNHKAGALQCLSNHMVNGWIQGDRTVSF